MAAQVSDQAFRTALCVGFRAPPPASALMNLPVWIAFAGLIFAIVVQTAGASWRADLDVRNLRRARFLSPQHSRQRPAAGLGLHDGGDHRLGRGVHRSGEPRVKQGR